MRTAFLTALCLTTFAAGAHAQAGPDTTMRPDSSAGKKELPLAASRTIDIDTDEGSWMSVDVSHDGQTIVFDLLGDLYTVPLGGGAARQVTGGLAFDAQPRFSPDGRWIAFTSDRDGAENVWIQNVETKETRQITRLKDKVIQSPAWTPDGKYIVATVGDIVFKPGKLWMFHIDGGTGVPILKSRDSTTLATGAAFGPDPRYLWYAQRKRSWQYNAIYPQYQIWMYDRETGRSAVRTSRVGSALRPTLSPDGRWMVYATRHEAKTGLVLHDMHSGDERWLAYPVQRDDQEAIASRDAYPGMAFTPDSREVVATYGGRIWRIPVDGGAPIGVPFRVRTQLGLGPKLAFRYPISDSTDFRAHQIRDVAQSPDGRRVAFTVLDRLYLLDEPNGTPRRVTSGDAVEAHPVWSPDGAWLAYVTWERDGGSLYKVRTRGTSAPVRLIAENGTYQHPAWSPDGTRIVVVRGPAEPRRLSDGPVAEGSAVDLVSIPAAGGAMTFIAPTWGKDEPHFSRDPNRIFLWAGDSGLVSIRWDGTDLKQHLRVTAPVLLDEEKGHAPERARISPDGDRALVQSGYDVYVVTVPMLGGDAPVVSIQDPKLSTVPARRLTDIGGEFAGWSGDGKSVVWSLGSALFRYDLDSAAAFDRAIEAQRKVMGADTSVAGRARLDSLGKKRFAASEQAVTVRVPRDIPRGTLVLRGARVVTMNGAREHEVIEDADVVVRDNRIVRVGSRGDVPAGARVMDVAGKTIVPGFVDTHAHMWPAWSLHKQQPWMYLANLAYGVTTTRDPQTGSSDVVTYGDEVEAGRMVGPRIYSTAVGVGYWLEPLRDLEHTRQVLKRYSRYWDTKFIKMYVKGNRQTRQWVIMAAREQGLMPTTEGGLDTKYDLTMLMDGYPAQEHSMPTVPLFRDVITAYARSGIEYTPTLLVQYGGPWAEEYYFEREQPFTDAKVRRFMPYEELAFKTRRRGQGVGAGAGGWFMDDEYIFPQTARIANEIVKAGGTIGVGSHGEFQGLGYHWELWSLASGGMSSYDVLRMATINGARALGLDGDLGSIESGKLADLVVLDRNPLDNIRHSNSVRYVMKNGRLYAGDSADELWPTARRTMAPYGLITTPVTAAGER